MFPPDPTLAVDPAWDIKNQSVKLLLGSLLVVASRSIIAIISWRL